MATKTLTPTKRSGVFPTAAITLPTTPAPLSCEVPKYVRDAIDTEASAQKRKRANMASVILTEWAEARTTVKPD